MIWCTVAPYKKNITGNDATKTHNIIRMEFNSLWTWKWWPCCGENYIQICCKLLVKTGKCSIWLTCVFHSFKGCFSMIWSKENMTCTETPWLLSCLVDVWLMVIFSINVLFPMVFIKISNTLMDIFDCEVMVIITEDLIGIILWVLDKNASMNMYLFAC